MRIGIAIPRASSISDTWTTIHLARAALTRGHSVRFIEPWDFQVEPPARVVARAHAFDPPSISADAMVRALQYREARRCFVDVGELDLLMIRIAPLRSDVLSFALLARSLGVPVVNDPSGVLLVSHKAWLASQPGVSTPPTLVTRSPGATHLYAANHPLGVVVKPARGSGGRAVTWVPHGDDAMLDTAFTLAMRSGWDGYVVVQPYLPEAEHGEKRLVWLDGELIGGYLRRRAPGEFRHNLKCGGVAESTEITDRDRSLVAPLSPALLGVGIRLAGLDVIGDQLIEVNAQNPGGAFHADRLHGSDLAAHILERLETP